MVSESVAEIKKQLEEAASLPSFIAKYEADERQGVRNLVQKAKKQWIALQKEEERIEKMKFFEKKYAEYALICGIDEVGRGPLAGPVCAGAVILPRDHDILYLNDSKKLTETKRKELDQVIRRESIAYATAFVSPGRIDEINILEATKEAMVKALRRLFPGAVAEDPEKRNEEARVKPDLLLIDALHLSSLPDIKQVSIIKGDEKSVSIAAASILAKVKRDHLMEKYAQIYPVYGFASNKGYGTEAHREAILKYGPCPIHRRTFIGNLV